MLLLKLHCTHNQINTWHLQYYWKISFNKEHFYFFICTSLVKLSTIYFRKISDMDTHMDFLTLHIAATVSETRVKVSGDSFNTSLSFSFSFISGHVCSSSARRSHYCCTWQGQMCHMWCVLICQAQHSNQAASFSKFQCDVYKVKFTPRL